MKVIRVCTTAAAVALAAAHAAPAAVVDGAVTGGTSGGSFKILAPGAGFEVGNDNQNSPDLFAFDEDQNIILPTTLTLGTAFPSFPDYQFTIAAGTVVASHYVFFDPVGTRSITGSVTFDSEILGVAADTDDLFATDFLANNAVTYNNPGLRGIETSDNFPSNQDSFFISADKLSLNIAFTASSPGDYVRVFTAQSPSGPAPMAPVPLPAPALLLVGGLGALAALRRRRRA